MKKITLNGQGVEVFYEELDNGLKVCLIPFKDKKNYFLSYATKYGSLHLDFMVDGREVSTVPGIAHFLEHKMFEQEDGVKPFEFFAKTGTDCNASTGFERTRYIVYGTNALEENLNFLIDYVNSPYFTDDNVEKEKGIIIEELNMYKGMPDRVINSLLNESVFNKHPARIDIGGTVDSVKSIRKEDLYKCYDTFYQPSNMVLVVGGTFDCESIMELIKNNSKLNSKKEKNKIVLKTVKEKEVVKDSYKEIELSQLTMNKVAFAIKTDVGVESAKDYKFREYISMIINILFGSSSIFKEELYTSRLVTTFAVDTYYIDNFMMIEFNAETNEPTVLVDKIIKHFKNQAITKEELERSKKVWIASIVFGTDIVYSMVNNIIGDLLTYGEVIEDRIDSIRGMNLKKLNTIRDSINYDNNTTLIARPKKDSKK